MGVFYFRVVMKTSIVINILMIMVRGLGDLLCCVSNCPQITQLTEDYGIKSDITIASLSFRDLIVKAYDEFPKFYTEKMET